MRRNATIEKGVQEDGDEGIQALADGEEGQQELSSDEQLSTGSYQVPSVEDNNHCYSGRSHQERMRTCLVTRSTGSGAQTVPEELHVINQLVQRCRTAKSHTYIPHRSYHRNTSS